MAELVANGERNKDIAIHLGIGEQAVKSLVSRLLAKFDVSNRVALVRVLAATGLAGDVASDAAVLRRWLSQVPAFIAILRGPTLKIEFVSAEIARLFENREIIGRTMRATFTELVGQGHFEIAEACYRSGKTVSLRRVPVRLNRKSDGTPEERYVDLIIEPLRDGGPAVTGIAVFALDVTEQRRPRRDLAQVTAQRETAHSHRKTGVMVLDSERRILFLNDAARRILHWQEKGPAKQIWDPLRYELRDFLTGQAYTWEATPCGRALAGRAVLDELCRYRPHGVVTESILEMSASPLRDLRGNVASAVVTFAQVAKTR